MEIADSFWSEWEKWKSNSNLQQNYKCCQSTIFEILNFNIIIFHLVRGYNFEPYDFDETVSLVSTWDG